MSRLLVILFGLVASVYGMSVSYSTEEEWNSFRLRYSKPYANDAEEQRRIKIFVENKNKIDKHNKLFEEGKVTYKMAVNQFADLTHDEMAQYAGCLDHSDALESNILVEASNVFTSNATKNLPSEIDWRSEGAVADVKDQKQCGSCWAFSAVAALEGQYFLKNGELIRLSEQNLVDCSRRNHGCRGGLMSRAYEYIKDNGGIETEKTYPYEGVDGKCRYNKQNTVTTVKGFKSISYKNEYDLQAALATVGPIAVAIHVSESLFFHTSGVFYEPKCAGKSLNHAVLAVGYGTDEDGQEYYIIKNSWGKSWGDGGYIKMARNRNNHCGIASMAIYPLI